MSYSTMKVCHSFGLALLFLLIACSFGDHVELSGRLIYSSGGSDIELLDLQSLKSEVIYDRSREVVSISHLTKVSEEKFLFDECAGVCSLKAFDLIRKAASELRKGSMPTYVSQSDTVFFYAFSEDTNEKWLFAASLGSLDRPRRVVKAPPPLRLPNGLLSEREAPVLQISPDEVLLIGEDYNLWSYTISKSTLQPLEIAHSFPAAWRGKNQELFCYDWDNKGYNKINLKTKRMEKLPQYDSAFGLFYIPEFDTLIYGRGRSHLLISERFDIFAYSFPDAREIKLRSHASISSGIWIP